MVNWHKNDLENRMYINIGDGKKAAMPRYYKLKIYTHEEKSIISGVQKRNIEVETNEAIQRYSGNSSYARDKNQAIIAAAKKQAFDSKKPERNKI